MHETVAFVGPAWLWLVATTALVAFVGACGWLLCWALGLRAMLHRQAEYHDNAAKVDEVEAVAKSLSGRITTLKRKATRPALPKVWDGADEESTAETVVSPT
jgi:multidrug resistance efflux pump